MNASCKIRQNSAIAWRVIEDEALLVEPRSQLIYPLNATGARIWELLDGERSIQDICAVIEEEFEADKIVIGQDVSAFIGDLVGKGLAEEVRFVNNG